MPAGSGRPLSKAERNKLASAESPELRESYGKSMDWERKLKGYLADTRKKSLNFKKGGMVKGSRDYCK